MGDPRHDPTLPDGPVRTCIGCRDRAAKTTLVRLVRVHTVRGDTVTVDPSQKLPGRGAYLHASASCVDLAWRRRAFTRAWPGNPATDPRWSESLRIELDALLVAT